MNNMEYPTVDALEPEIHEPVPVIASHEPEDPPPTSLSLETRFERILELVEEAGFDTLDGMAAAYYTAKFQPDSRAHYAQFQSRTRYLRPFLQALNINSTDWPRREAAGYKDGIARSAVGVYVEELAGLRQRQQQQTTRETGSPASTGSSDGPDTASLGSRRAVTFAEKFRQFFMAVDASQGFKRDSQVFREQVSSFSFNNPWLCPLVDALNHSPLDRSTTNKPSTPGLTGASIMVFTHPTCSQRRTARIPRFPNCLRLSIHPRCTQMTLLFISFLISNPSAMVLRIFAYSEY